MIDTKRTLNKNIPVPLYYQLKEILLDVIQNAKEGDPFPTEIDLCEQFDISRTTVRQAMNELVSEGYLQRMKGKGTFVAEPKVKQDFFIALTSFNEEMQRQGLVPRTKVLELKRVTADAKIAKALNVPAGIDVVKLVRLRSVNDKVVLLLMTFLPDDKFPGILSMDFENKPLYQTVEEDFGYVIERATRRIEARKASKYEAQLLEIEEEEPILFVETIAYLNDGTPFEYSFSRYRGDRSEFSLELSRRK